MQTNVKNVIMAKLKQSRQEDIIRLAKMHFINLKEKCTWLKLPLWLCVLVLATVFHNYELLN